MFQQTCGHWRQDIINSQKDMLSPRVLFVQWNWRTCSDKSWGFHGMLEFYIVACSSWNRNQKITLYRYRCEPHPALTLYWVSGSCFDGFSRACPSPATTMNLQWGILHRSLDYSSTLSFQGVSLESTKLLMFLKDYECHALERNQGCGWLAQLSSSQPPGCSEVTHG